MAKVNLSTSFRCLGYWWIDGVQDRMVAGTFEYDPTTGCSLQLHGELWESPIEGPIPIIRGTSATNELLTLLKAWPIRNRHQDRTFAVVEAVCEVALVGDFHPDSSFEFNSSSARFQHLDDWIHAKYIERKYNKNGRLSYSIKPGQQASLACASGNYDLSFSADYHFEGTELQIAMESFTSMNLRPRKPQKLEWLVKELMSVRALASLSFGLPAPLHSIHLYGKTKQKKGFGKQTQSVSALFLEDGASKVSHSSYPIISLKRLQIVAPDILSAWYDLREPFAEAIDLLVLLLGRHHKTTAIGFLLTMQAFEAFDRKANPEPLVAEDVFKAVADAMIAAMPNIAPTNLRSKMKAAIRYANEPSLRNRLKALHKRLEEELNGDTLGFERSKIEPIVQTRNYFTHYPDDLRPLILSQENQTRETDRFVLILILLIFDQLGVPFRELLNGIFLNGRFRYLVGNRIDPGSSSKKA
ncbi:hypothetical protein LZK77_16185 [Rhizobium leguminosarum]|nr:hypothetical protein LZK77_16185 [Rhizobium leguminosarum]